MSVQKSVAVEQTSVQTKPWSRPAEPCWVTRDEWTVLSPVFVRSTGLAVDALKGLRDRRLNNAANTSEADDLADVLAAALERSFGEMTRWAAHPLFEEALAWQNPGTLATFRSLAAGGPAAPRNARRRDREHRLVRYLTRYAGKTETIGFFGPAGIGALTRTLVHLQIEPGPGLLRLRRTFPEPWAVRRLGAALAADDRVRPWLPVRRRTHLGWRRSLAGTEAGQRAWTPLELAILAACDGDRRPADLAWSVAASEGRRVGEVERCIEDLLARRVLVVDANLPLGPECVDVLSSRIRAVGHPATRAAAKAVVAPFLAGLAHLAEAAGDAARVQAGHEDLAAAFREAARSEPSRRTGQMYAGRSVVFEECVRDLEVRVGDSFLGRLDQVMPALLTIGRWLTYETARRYDGWARAHWGVGQWPLQGGWYALLRSFYGSGPRPVDAVLDELRRRWATVLATARGESPGRRSLEPTEFAVAVEREFAAPEVGWRLGAFHSPDLMVGEHTPGGAERGDYTVVVSEMHFAQPTFNGPVFEWFLEDNAVTRVVADLIGPRLVPLYPESWPRNTGRTMITTLWSGDVPFAFADLEGAPDRSVAVADLDVLVGEDNVQVLLPDGRRAPFTELLATFLTAVTTDAWKVLSAEPHVPRLTVGDVTLVREAWRMPLNQTPWAEPARREIDCYRAVQRWRSDLGMPDEVYLGLPGEEKPFYVAFDAPAMVLACAASARAAARRGQADQDLKISEAHPLPDQAWITDAEGKRYLGELRMVAVDDAHLRRLDLAER